MKSKRRHELQTNELADRLGHWIERIKPYTTLITIVVVGAVLIVAAWYYVAANRERELNDSWRSYLAATASDQLASVADDFPNTTAGLWAAQAAADMDTAEGVQALFTDRTRAKERLTSAKKRYQAVLSSDYVKDDLMLKRRAHYGLAQALEADAELEKARENYAAVVESGPETALGKAAQKRMDALESAEAKNWYNWFAKQEPAKPAMWDRGTGVNYEDPKQPGVIPNSNLESLLDQTPGGFMDSTTSTDTTGETSETPSDASDAAAKSPPATIEPPAVDPPATTEDTKTGPEK